MQIKHKVNKKVDKMFKELEEQRPYPSHEDRVIEVEKFLETIEYTDEIVLERLGTYILKEDNRKYKGSKLPDKLEHPYLSNSQEKTRKSREASDQHWEDFDSDGNSLKVPTRSSRIKDEVSRGDIKF